MFRPVGTVQLPGMLFNRLQESGHLYCEDVYVNISDNAKGSEAYNLLKLLCTNPLDYWKSLTAAPITCSALDIWQQEECSTGVLTFCKAIDDLLDGGIPVRSITELCGAPGSGKTQLCFQLCVDVQIPVAFGGLGGQAVYIDTDCGFSTERLLEIAENCVEHCKSVAWHQNKEDLKLELQDFTSSSISQNIHYIYRENLVQLMSVVPLIKELLRNGANVKLIVIDSINFPFIDCTSMLERTRLLYQLLGDLQALAAVHGIAVVVTNQVTTRLNSDSEWSLMPALGDSFGHRVNWRLMLARVRLDDFTAVLLKTYMSPTRSVPFKILTAGVRDIT